MELGGGPQVSKNLGKILKAMLSESTMGIGHSELEFKKCAIFFIKKIDLERLF